MKRFLVCLITLAGCSQEPLVDGRWYTQSQITQGAAVFSENCAVCHGNAAEGQVKNWQQPLRDGSYPPPPLNGTAHTWHHPMPAIKRTIYEGGIAYGGKMPPFGDKLTKEEIEAVISFFQNKWPDNIYQAWQKRN